LILSPPLDSMSNFQERSGSPLCMHMCRHFKYGDCRGLGQSQQVWCPVACLVLQGAGTDASTVYTWTTGSNAVCLQWCQWWV